MCSPQIVNRHSRKHMFHGDRVGFKIASYYLHGKRAHKFLPTREAAETFVEAEEIKRENLGSRAVRIDGVLAEDAVRPAVGGAIEFDTDPWLVRRWPSAVAAINGR